MPGTKGHSGGQRPGAGRPATYKRVELTERASKDLANFIDDLALPSTDAHVIVSTILSQALSDDYDKWRHVFGDYLIKAE